MKTTLTFFLALLISLNLFAQAPELMSYQAVIRDANNGLLTNTTVGMQISILEGSSTGTVMYVEMHTLSTNSNGLISLEIGSGMPVFGTMADVDWTDGSYFVKTETDPDGGSNYSITGTSRLTSVPYALAAQSAEFALTAESALIAQYADSAQAAQAAQMAQMAQSAQTAQYADTAGYAWSAQFAAAAPLADRAVYNDNFQTNNTIVKSYNWAFLYDNHSQKIATDLPAGFVCDFVYYSLFNGTITSEDGSNMLYENGSNTAVNSIAIAPGDHIRIQAYSSDKVFITVY